MSRLIDDEEALQDNGLIEIDGCNTLKERKLLIKTENYSIGEDGLIDREIPFTDICYDLALRLQRMKAENEELKQYKQSKQASYEAMQTEWNNAVNENRLLRSALKNKNFVAIAEENERLKAENEQLKKEVSDLNFYIDSYKIVWEIDKYRQALEEIRESCNAYAKTEDFVIDQTFNEFFENIFFKINEVLKDVGN